MRIAFVVVALSVLVQTQGTTPGQAPGTTPSACVKDLRTYTTQRQQALRTALPTLPPKPSDDDLRAYQARLSQLSTETIQTKLAMAKACTARFDVKTVEERELPSLIDLYSEAGQPELAAAGMERALGLKGLPETERANILVQAVRLGLLEPKGEARNARLEQHVDELDRLSSAVADQKFSVHSSMNSYYRFDDIDAGIIKHSTWLIETGRTCDPALRVKYGSTLASAYVNMAEAWAGQGMNDQALELMDRGLKDLADLKGGARDPTSYISSTLPRYKLVGTPAAGISASRWLNMPAAGAARIEMTGHVTLLEFTAHWCGPCKESYPGIKRLLAKYGPRGFRVVLATEMYGYFGAERNLTPDQEFERDRDYFQKEGMAVPVAVSDRLTQVLDGRSIYKPNPNDEAYKVGGIPQIQLIDRQGRIRLIMVGYDDANEAKLAKIIEGLLALSVSAQSTPDAAVKAVIDSPKFKTAMAALDKDHDRVVSEIVQLTEIPAPPFKEAARAKAYMAMLKAHGLTSVEQDAEGNVMGVRRGLGKAPLIAIAAHLDTVFPDGTDVKVKRDGTRLSAPGIGDDTRSLAVLLALIRAMDAAGIQTQSDLLFIGNVGEEGLGDLRGVKHLFQKGPYRGRIGMFISMDGSGGGGEITNGGVGSKRYRAAFKGPGGHSYGAFGLVSPAFAMGSAMEKLGRMQVPASPKTTFNVGVVGGGTSVNSIPFESWMEIDLRSESPAELEKLNETMMGLLNEAVVEENKARSTRQGPVTLDLKLVGDRPSGQTPVSSRIVQTAAAAARAAGLTPGFRFGSTDSNIPISLGIPAITIDSGGSGGRAHALDEWIDVEKTASLRGMQVALALLLALAGSN